MTEKDIERRLVQQVRRIGGKAYKFVSPGNNGVPDRLICMPGGRVAFVELKAPGKLPRPVQVHQINALRAMGFRAEVLDNKDAVDNFVESLQGDEIT